MQIQYNNDLLYIIKKCRVAESPGTLVNEYISRKWEKFELELTEKGINYKE